MSVTTLQTQSQATASKQIRKQLWGQCENCMRLISLTKASRLYTHGRGCIGSEQPPVVGSVTDNKPLSASQVSTWQVSASVVSADAACKDISSADELRIVLLQHRRRVVKRIPKGSRLNAAEKLSDILENIVADPSCLRNWINL
jgi:hypothetical protein